MTAINSWELLNQPRDLTDVLSTLIAEQPMFLRKFPLKPPATNVKHEWLEDVLRPRTISYTAYAQATGTFTVADSSGWLVGDYVRVKGDSAIFKVASLTATTIVVSFVASNGSATDAIGDIATTAGTLIFDSHPISQGSSSGQTMFSQSGTGYNYTQIFRGDIEITNTALATATFGNENDLNLQIQRGLIQISREINRAALFGSRAAVSSSEAGRAGGLYYFGTQTGGLSVTASGALSLKYLNDAAQAVLDAGGTPDAILCGQGQARVISQLMRSQISIPPGDGTRGAFVNRVVLESTGQVAEVFIEPALSAMDTDVWVIDSSALGLVQLGNRQIHTENATTPGLDGRKYSLIGELTFEFKNAKQKLCRISGCTASATALT